jgi:hypothetical protein
MLGGVCLLLKGRLDASASSRERADNSHDNETLCPTIKGALLEIEFGEKGS